MRKLLSLSSILLTFWAAPALAENWVQILHQSRMTVSIDRDSISRNGNIVDFQGQIVWDDIMYNSSMEGGKYKMVLNQEEIDCVKQTYENTSARFFDETGTMVHSEGSEGVQPIRPNSVAALKAQATCG